MEINIFENNPREFSWYEKENYTFQNFMRSVPYIYSYIHNCAALISDKITISYNVRNQISFVSLQYLYSIQKKLENETFPRDISEYSSRVIFHEMSVSRNIKGEKIYYTMRHPCVQDEFLKYIFYQEKPILNLNNKRIRTNGRFLGDFEPKPYCCTDFQTLNYPKLNCQVGEPSVYEETLKKLPNDLIRNDIIQPYNVYDDRKVFITLYYLNLHNLDKNNILILFQEIKCNGPVGVRFIISSEENGEDIQVRYDGAIMGWIYDYETLFWIMRIPANAQIRYIPSELVINNFPNRINEEDELDRIRYNFVTGRNTVLYLENSDDISNPSYGPYSISVELKNQGSKKRPRPF